MSGKHKPSMSMHKGGEKGSSKPMPGKLTMQGKNSPKMIPPKKK
jgi:hypothetical protein